MKQFSYDVLCAEVFFKSKDNLGLNDLYLSIEKFNNDTYAYLDENTIFVNEKMFKASKIYEIIDTIFHETRHYFQHITKETKKLKQK